MKIAVDLDDTLSIVDRVSRGQAYIQRKGLPFRLRDPDSQHLLRVFDWTEEDAVEFVRDGGITVYTEAELRPGARETLTRWREEGHTVVVLTARLNAFFENPYSISRDWLEKRKIPYDELAVVTSGKGMYCAEHGISLLVDNDLENCLDAQRHGVSAILMVSRETLPRAREVRFGGANWKQVEGKADVIFRTAELEALTARAVRARRVESYDGWTLSFDGWKQPRGNCVRPAMPSRLALEDKIVVCEEKYRAEGRACRFLLTPSDLPLDDLLSRRGYLTERMCFQMTAELDRPYRFCEVADVYEEPSEPWLRDYYALHGTEKAREFRLTQGKAFYVSVRVGGEAAAVATGILDGEWLGLYDVYTREDLRRLGYGRAVCETALREGARRGARRAYLQMQAGNREAELLYTGLGFARAHEYWYRVK